MKILYEDNHLIAVYKPSGLLVQGDISSDRCLMDQVKDYLKEHYKKPGNVFLGLLHRLDRPVSGVVLFAKTSKGASRLSEQFRNHTIQKIYHAMVSGVPMPKKAVLKHYLVKDREKNFTKVYDENVKGSLHAELEYEVVESFPDKSLLQIVLKTGRSHQIRAQLAFIGHPIIGDKKYGSAVRYKDGAIALQATVLRFKKATSDEIVEVNCELYF